jgi:hypothetical protein
MEFRLFNDINSVSLKDVVGEKSREVRNEGNKQENRERRNGREKITELLIIAATSKGSVYIHHRD